MNSERWCWEDTDVFNTQETQDSLLNDFDISLKEIQPLGRLPETTVNVTAGQQDVLMTISQSKALKDYKLYPEDHYLVAGRWKCVFLDTSPWHAGLMLVVSLRYKSFSHENQPVKACLNDSQEMHPPANHCKEACFRLLCSDADSRVKYFLNEENHPTAEVSLMGSKEHLAIQFLCRSSCSHHTNYGKLTILKLGQRLETTRMVIWRNSYTVRVAAYSKSRADVYYKQDIGGETSPNKSPCKKQKLQSHHEELGDSSMPRIKEQKVDSESEPNDESTIEQGLAVALNGASSVVSGGLFTSSSGVHQETTDSIQLFSSNGTNGGATAGNEPNVRQLVLLADTSGNYFPGDALQQPGAGTESEVIEPMVGPSATDEDTKGVSTSRKALVVLLRHHDKNARLIREIVSLEGGTCNEMDLHTTFNDEELSAVE